MWDTQKIRWLGMEAELATLEAEILSLDLLHL